VREDEGLDAPVTDGDPKDCLRILRFDAHVV
jgi:hypothetical protein